MVRILSGFTMSCAVAETGVTGGICVTENSGTLLKQQQRGLSTTCNGSAFSVYVNVRRDRLQAYGIACCGSCTLLGCFEGYHGGLRVPWRPIVVVDIPFLCLRARATAVYRQ